jgi:hypothetical protein
MATTKKTTKKASTAKTSKPAAAKKVPASKATKVVAKKPTAKKTTVKKTGAKSVPQTVSMKSFRVARDQQSFSTFQITRQTVYWIVLIAFIILAQLWILKLQVEVASLLESQQTELQSEN